jgi:hypothetical protein
MILKSIDLVTVGEQHVAAALAALGYSCRQDVEDLDPTDILATGPASLLVHVKTSLYPAPPPELTWEEKREVVSRAASIGGEAWLASLRVNSIGEPVGEIVWGKIGTEA